MQPPGRSFASVSRADGKLGESDEELARAAFAAGCAAAVRGDRDAAIPWLDRACRLSPGDRTYTLALATHSLASSPARAAILFASVTASDDVREAWVGLASARLHLGDAQQAAAALGHALSHHALMPGVEGLADAIAGSVGASGWCALATGGHLRISAAPAGAAIQIFLDGRAMPWAGRHEFGTDPEGLALPKSADAARCLAVRIGGREALGSPIVLAAIRGIEGVVDCRDGGLEGWAWHPGDPDREPVLHLTPASGRRRIIVALPGDHTVVGARALARARRFEVSAASLARMRGPFAVSAPDGAALLGSPLDPTVAAGTVPAEAVGPSPPVGLVRRRRPVDVVIAVRTGLDAVLGCLDSVLAHTPRGARIVVIDAAAPEPLRTGEPDRLATRRRIVRIHRSADQGFAATVNAALRACAGRDVVLLNGDAVVPQDWLDRLRAAAYAAPDIGSVSPFSNGAALVFYPAPSEAHPAADAAGVDRLARRANGAETIDIPVGDAVCLYLRRDCIDATGLMREDSFAQGDGAEADFCLRARHLGWRHVAATGVFVAHAGGQSSRAVHGFLLSRSQAVLNRLHPGFDALVDTWSAAGGLAASRRRLDEARWRATRPRGRVAPRSVLLITHDAGGGVEHHLAARCAAIAATGDRPVLLRPARTAGGDAAASIGGVARDVYPNLIYHLPLELRLLTARLRAERPKRVELHHLMDHDPAVLRLLPALGVPYEVHVHDYAWFCPRVVLVGPQRRYCGEPAPAVCETCLSEAGRVIEEDIPVQALIDRSARVLGSAERVIVPSQDAAARMRRHFPGIRPKVLPHEHDAATLRAGDHAPAAAPTCRVVTVGAIGIQKGFDVLLDCARDAASRRLPLEFVVVGHTIDDASLMSTGRVFVTGEFAPAEALTLIRAQHPTLALLPSIWPETWCFALTDLWQAGLRVAAFDLGAPAERIRASGGRGMLLPLGLSASEINDALLAAVAIPGHQ